MVRFFSIYGIYMIGMLLTYGYQFITSDSGLFFDHSVVYVLYNPKSVAAFSLVFFLVYFLFFAKFESSKEMLSDDELDNPFRERVTEI